MTMQVISGSKCARCWRFIALLFTIAGKRDAMSKWNAKRCSLAEHACTLLGVSGSFSGSDTSREILLMPVQIGHL